MWLSEQLSQTKGYSAAEEGNVTLSDVGTVAACGSAEVRNIPIYGPGGMDYVPSEGENVLLLPCSGGTVCVGVLLGGKSLSPGEISLFSEGGARIVLKNNGDAVINGVTVTQDGKIYAKKIITEG